MNKWVLNVKRAHAGYPSATRRELQPKQRGINSTLIYFDMRFLHFFQLLLHQSWWAEFQTHMWKAVPAWVFVSDSSLLQCPGWSPQVFCSDLKLKAGGWGGYMCAAAAVNISVATVKCCSIWNGWSTRFNQIYKKYVTLPSINPARTQQITDTGTN